MARCRYPASVPILALMIAIAMSASMVAGAPGTATVTGTIVDSDGSPMEGATIAFTGIEAGDSVSALIGQSGTFIVELGFDVYNVEVTFGSEIVFEGTLETFTGSVDMGTMVLERPTPTGVVTGTVIDIAYRPVTGADIVVTGEDFSGNATSDGNGSFSIVSPLGELHVSIRYGGEELYEGTSLLDGPIMDMGAIVTTYDPGYLSVSGRVVDPQGAPVPGASVNMSGVEAGFRWEGVTDDDGSFSAHLLPDVYRLELSSEGLLRYDGTFELSEGPLDLGDLMMEDVPTDESWWPFVAIPLVLVVIVIIIVYVRRPRPSRSVDVLPESPEPSGPPVISGGGTSSGVLKPPSCADLLRELESMPDPMSTDAAEAELALARGDVENARGRVERAREELHRARAEGVDESQGRLDEIVEEIDSAHEELSRMRDRMRELRRVPTPSGVSLVPRVGWGGVGTGYGDMLRPTTIYYRDDTARREHQRTLDRMYDEYRELSQGIEGAEDRLREAERALADMRSVVMEGDDDLSRQENELREAREALEDAREHEEEARDGLDRATSEASELASRRSELESMVGRCGRCLDDLRGLMDEVRSLRAQYLELLEGAALGDARDALSAMDPEGTWDDWWGSFKAFRDRMHDLSDVVGLVEADIPERFQGIWDWGGPVGTTVGYAMEGAANVPIPTDVIPAVGGLYGIMGSYFDPSTALGARVLMQELGERDYTLAASAFRDAPGLLRDAIESMGDLCSMRDVDRSISESIAGWRVCLDSMPEPPELPMVDLDSLCLEQCHRVREEWGDLRARLEALVRGAEACEPVGLNDAIESLGDLRDRVRGMSSRMRRAENGLRLYARAHASINERKGCFISTAVYGTSDAPQLDTLRWFRDEVMGRSALGRAMVGGYYVISPDIAERMGRDVRTRDSVRGYVALAVDMIGIGRRERGTMARAIWCVTTSVYVIGCVVAWVRTRFPPQHDFYTRLSHLVP